MHQPFQTWQCKQLKPDFRLQNCLGIFEVENNSIPIKTDYKLKTFSIAQEELVKCGDDFKITFEIRNNKHNNITAKVKLKSNVLSNAKSQKVNFSQMRKNKYHL